MNVFLGHDGIGLRVKRSFRIGIAHPVSLQRDYLISSLYIYIYIYMLNRDPKYIHYNIWNISEEYLFIFRGSRCCL